MGSEHLYLANRALIEQTMAAICRRYRLSSQDAEEFAGVVRLHLIEDDYAVLRKFQNRSSLKTFLITVITHKYQDWRNARWGKWRPSAEAKRQGPLGIHLERLMIRDGLSFEQAQESLRTNFQVSESRQLLERIAARLPPRPQRRFVSEDVLDLQPGSHGADGGLRAVEAAAAARVAAQAITAALSSLPPQDRLLLRMRFEDGLSIVEIARALALEQKPLYRRVARLLAELRASLESAGLTAAAAGEILEAGGFDLLPDGAESGEISRPVRPLRRDDDSAPGATRTP